MTTTPADAVRIRPSRKPAVVIAAATVMIGAIAFDILTGIYSGLTSFGLGWAEADRANIEIPQHTWDALRLGFWHPVIWTLPRSVLAWSLHKGSRVGRAIAIAVETLAVGAWAPLLFIGVEGSIGVVESFDFTAIRGAAVVCMAASAAALVLLFMPATRAWCARRRPVKASPGPVH